MSWNFGNPEARHDEQPADHGARTFQSRISFRISRKHRSAQRTSPHRRPRLPDSGNGSRDSGDARCALRSGGYGDEGICSRNPTRVQAAPIVVGDAFVDESDGTIESHYASWAIDGAVTKATADQAIDVGQCGAHSVVFYWLRWSVQWQQRCFPDHHASLRFPVIPGDFIVGLDANNGAVNYAVRPFAAAVDFIGASGPKGLIFCYPSSSCGLDSLFLTLSQQGFLRWTGELLDSGGVPSLTQTAAGRPFRTIRSDTSDRRAADRACA